jgi:DNA sulfur modification protein DndD
MKLISIKLCNFRSFYGITPEIMLADSEIVNTTVIYGNNGAGKTSLLNAFTWVLYERFSAAFASTEQLVNKRAIAQAQNGEAVQCWVELAWEHDNKRYRVKRQCRAYKAENDIDAGKTELYMQFSGDDGRWLIPSQQPEVIINQILPSSLHQYFFFDGERIEQIVRTDKKTEIAEATKMLLGVEVINRSIKHLAEAKKTLENDLKAIGNSGIKQLLRQQSKLDLELETITNRQEEIIQEIERQQTLKKTVSSRLRELDSAKNLQEKRQRLDNQKQVYQEQLQKSRENTKRIISTRGYTVLLRETTANFRSVIDKLKQNGELKAGISREFVQDLLNSQTCICGANLTPGTHSHNHVSNLLNQAGSSIVEETTIRMSSQVDEIDKQSITFWEELDKEQAVVSQLRENIAQIESELDNIQDILRKDPSEEIRNLQKRLEDIEVKITDLTLEQGRNQQRNENYQTELEDLKKQISRQKLNEERQILAQRRISATQDAIERLAEVKSRQEQQFRLQLEQRVQEIFSEISVTPYIPKINDKYELILIENTSGIELPVAASTGQNQILSLSFISSIIDRVREWSEKQKMLMLPESSTFPIVMDSPFGSLDEINRRQIAKIIPRMANQLVVILTKTQWRGEVEKEMKQRVGKEYVLTYFSSKADCEQDYIEIKGERYPLVKQSPSEFEYTEIMEVREND